MNPDAAQTTPPDGADVRVLVKVGRMIIARDWALVEPGDEFKLDDDDDWRVR